MSRRDKMKHLKSVCSASEFQTHPMSETQHVRDCTPSVVPSTLALLPKPLPQVVISTKVSSSSQQRTHDVEPLLGEFLPKTHIEVCVVEVREAHDEFSHLLNRGALLCRICQLVYPTPQTSSTPRALQPPHLLWTRTSMTRREGRLSSPSMYLTGVPFCSHAKRFVNGSLAFLQMRTITGIRNGLGRLVRLPAATYPF